jgi:TatD DNase family protein
MSYFVDTHCHLHEPWFSSEMIVTIIQDAKTVNVKKIVNCASDPSLYRFVLDNWVANSLIVSLGIQPTIVDEYSNVDSIKKLLDDNSVKDKIVAIGEVGLDYHWVKDHLMHNKQKELFKSAITLANERSLPLVIHSRKAEGDCLDMLEKYSETPVLLHSFEGNLKQVTRAVDLGYLISIPTNVVIRANRRKVAKRAGLENIVLETDSPYCAPIQNMFPNTPSSIPIAANKISRILEVSVDEIAKITTNKAEEFYRLK